jgi:hypothetical protein
MAVKMRWHFLICSMLLSVAVGAVVRIYAKQGMQFLDFYSFWYGGNLIRQGTDPYRAFLNKEKVCLPVSYLDGVTIKEGEIGPFKMQLVPGNTAPVVFLLTPLAHFSWNTAKTVWYALNVVFSIAIGWILLKIFNTRFLSREGMLLIPLFLMQISTREVLDLGQTSLLIVFCSFVSMFLSYQNRTTVRAIASGLLLGLAISKPLLAFPLLLLFLYRRRMIELITATLFQCVGILGVVLLGTSPREVVAEYYKIFMMHAGPGTQDGLYLTAGILKGWTPYSYILIILGSGVLGLVLLRWILQRSNVLKVDIRTDMVLLTVIMLWNLLVFYHRRYDYVASVSFIAIMVTLFINSGGFLLRSAKERALAFMMAGAIFLFWILPGYRLISQAAYRGVFNLLTLVALIMSACIMFRLPNSHQAQQDGWRSPQ